MLLISSENKGGIWFAIAQNDKGKLVACAFSEHGQADAVKGVMNSIPKRWWPNCKATSPDQSKFKILYELYVGEGTISSDAIDLSHVSPFRRKVYRTLQRIPKGRVTTYGAIARKLASRRHARAVGTAVGSNPLPLIIPCHRVVTTALEVVNYGMPNRKPSEGAPVKRGLLEREGVIFVEGKPSIESLWS